MSNIQYFSLKETLAVSNINTNDKQKVEFENTDNNDKGGLYFICNDEELDEDKDAINIIYGPIYTVSSIFLNKRWQKKCLKVMMNHVFVKTMFAAEKFFLCYGNNFMLMLYFIFNLIIKISCLINVQVGH